MSPKTRSPASTMETRHVPDGDDRRLEFRLEIEAPSEEVWKALTDADVLERWFPFQARVEPGENGSIWMSWDGAWEGTNRIRIWEPGKRLQTEWAENPRSTPLAVDYFLEGEGGRTRLRLVHHGFGPDEDWDEMYDGIRRGWSFELRCLRHYLENHRGRERKVATAVLPLGDGADPSREWRRILSADVLGLQADPESLREGEPARFRTFDGDHLEGRVLFWEAPREGAFRIEGWNDALLRIVVEKSGPHGELAASVWLETWDVDPDEVDALQTRWRQRLAALA